MESSLKTVLLVVLGVLIAHFVEKSLRRNMREDREGRYDFDGADYDPTMTGN